MQFGIEYSEDPMKTFKILFVLVLALALLTACGGKATFSFNGSVVFGADTVTLKDGAQAVVVEPSTFTKDETEITLVPGQVITAKGDVVINFTAKTIVGQFDLLTPVASATPALPPTATATPTDIVPTTTAITLTQFKLEAGTLTIPDGMRFRASAKTGEILADNGIQPQTEENMIVFRNNTGKDIKIVVSQMRVDQIVNEVGEAWFWLEQ